MTSVVTMSTSRYIYIGLSKPPLPDILTLRSVPLPKSIFILTCASSVASSILLVVSMLDLGLLSLWINPCASLFTLVYNISTLILAHRKRRIDTPSYFSTCIVCAYILAVLWLVAFSVTTMVLVSWKGNYKPEVLHQQQGLPVTVHTQRLQCFLAGVELFTLGGIAVKGHLIAREGDPKSWRPMYEDDKVRFNASFRIPHDTHPPAYSGRPLKQDYWFPFLYKLFRR
ncbi:hypothetical protein FB451DRAFT_7293 [Mycena latifolia]|nr:hypothetical protein FB451DRAFT_7293 [Mycena latifolia]